VARTQGNFNYTKPTLRCTQTLSVSMFQCSSRANDTEMTAEVSLCECKCQPTQKYKTITSANSLSIPLNSFHYSVKSNVTFTTSGAKQNTKTLWTVDMSDQLCFTMHLFCRCTMVERLSEVRQQVQRAESLRNAFL